MALPIRLAKTCSMAVGSPQAGGRSATIDGRPSLLDRPPEGRDHPADDRGDLDQLAAILDLAGPGEPEQGVDDRR